MSHPSVRDFTVRPERPADRAAIAAVVEAAFGSPAEARLVAAIRASDNFIDDLSLVAERDEEILGHVMISHVGLRTAERTVPVASLSPLAVAPTRQREGVGSALVHEVTTAADARGEPLVVLEGSPDYYGRLGFEHSVPLGITIDLPSWAPSEAAQLMRLGNYDPAIRGHIVYPPAFDSVAHD